MFTLFICSAQLLFAQEKKISLNIEYSPNFSKLTDEIIKQSLKLSHNALLRIQYNTKGKIKPTLGLGFLNTGSTINADFHGQMDIDEVTTTYNYNYVFLPVGTKIYFGEFYVFPEIGLGINISNKSTQIFNFTNGTTEKKTSVPIPTVGEIDKISIPASLSVGMDFTIGSKTFSTGFKGYYGITHVIKNGTSKRHYYGLGMLLAMYL